MASATEATVALAATENTVVVVPAATEMADSPAAATPTCETSPAVKELDIVEGAPTSAQPVSHGSEAQTDLHRDPQVVEGAPTCSESAPTSDEGAPTGDRSAPTGSESQSLESNVAD